MTTSIAFAGKGGSGKTTLAALSIRRLLQRDDRPLLAVDADPNANLGESLGLSVKETIGSVIASFNKEKITIPPGMTKENYLEYRLNRSLTETQRFDLIAMGWGEGPDCYCYPNLVLRNFMDTLAGNYAYLVMDNEAGMEHLSRRTTQDVDELIVVTSHSVKGVRAVARIRALASELDLLVKRLSVVVNMVPPEMDPHVRAELARLDIESFYTVPIDSQVCEYDLEMKPLLDLPDSSPAVASVNEFIDRLINIK